MPFSKYFSGKGKKVMSNMQEQYGDNKGKQVFYATANKNGMKPDDKQTTDDQRNAHKPKRKSLGQRIAESE